MGKPFSRMKELQNRINTHKQMKFEKYIYSNLGYHGNDSKPHSLLMMDITNESDHVCDHCNKPITGNVYHFDEYKDYYNDGSKKWAFCYKCMPVVVGVGLK